MSVITSQFEPLLISLYARELRQFRELWGARLHKLPLAADVIVVDEADACAMHVSFVAGDDVAALDEIEIQLAALRVLECSAKMGLVSGDAVMRQDQLALIDVINGDHRAATVREGVAGEALHDCRSGGDNLVVQAGMFPIWSDRLPVSSQAFESRERGSGLQFFSISGWFGMEGRRDQQQKMKQCEDALDRHGSFSMRAAFCMSSRPLTGSTAKYAEIDSSEKKIVENAYSLTYGRLDSA